MLPGLGLSFKSAGSAGRAGGGTQVPASADSGPQTLGGSVQKGKAAMGEKG